MRVNKNVNDLNYLGRFGGIYYYEDHGTVYTQLSINEYERWGILDFSRYSEQKGLFVNPFLKN